MNYKVIEWAIRNGVNAQALTELRAIFAMDTPNVPSTWAPEYTEAYSQSVVRLEAAHKGVKLWRNNVGVLDGPSGVPVRYGLANDSKRLNETIKSGDLIGWRSITITPDHIGSVIAQFVSRECKRPGWRYSGTFREMAQLRWAEAVIADGGDATFCTGEGTL